MNEWSTAGIAEKKIFTLCCVHLWLHSNRYLSIDKRKLIKQKNAAFLYKIVWSGSTFVSQHLIRQCFHNYSRQMVAQNNGMTQRIGNISALHFAITMSKWSAGSEFWSLRISSYVKSYVDQVQVMSWWRTWGFIILRTLNTPVASEWD